MIPTTPHSPPPVMSSWFFPERTGPGALTRADVPTPQPGPGEILVRMRAASLNYRDVLIANGKGPGPILERLVPLSDGAGEVAGMHADVAGWKIGDRVAGCFMPAWQDGELPANGSASVPGGPQQGVLAEYRVFRHDAIVRVPEHLSFVEAATLPCAALTAWNALFGFHPVKAGDTVLVLGTGGVSMFALQFAVLTGATAIVASSSERKLAIAGASGAAHLINYSETPQWQHEVRRLTGGRGADHVVEVGGGGTLERSLASVRVGGFVHMIGVLSAGTIDPRLIMTSGAVVRGVRVGSRAMFQDMNGFMSVHGMRPVIHATFGFERAPEAFRALEAAGHVGKIAIKFA
jgi:NADPH:quinone reductase-like Zn-dependent oxidoreductase